MVLQISVFRIKKTGKPVNSQIVQKIQTNLFLKFKGIVNTSVSQIFH